jgi:hypothetical protein
MSLRRRRRPIDEEIADDLLRGLTEISEFIDENERKTAHLIRRGEIPAGRLGHEYVASKQRLREHYRQLTASFMPARDTAAA